MFWRKNKAASEPDWSAQSDDRGDDPFDETRRYDPDLDEDISYRSGTAQEGRNQTQPDYDGWDVRLDEFDRQVAVPDRSRQRWWYPSYWRGRRKLWWIGRAIAAFLLLLFIIVAWLAFTAPLSRSLEPIAPPQLTLVASDGTPIARNGAVTDDPVKIATLPDHVVHAFLAIEDRRFYSHWGVDPYGIGRAVLKGVGGGSTITQQLAKFTFLTPEQTLSRKLREMLIAFWLEGWLTKDEILERYLSNAYFGDNMYGLRAASLHYFYRQPENLTQEQAAMLAGLVQAPSRYAPTHHYARAKRRMDLVKRALVDAGYITQAEADAMPYPKVDSRTKNNLPTGTYFADWVLPAARKATQSGYDAITLTTTLDSRLQRIARNVTSRAPLGQAQVALVAMRPNGEVVAMIGGKDYAASPFNRATQARRQPGSTFKLFVYLAALEAGWDADDLVDNSEITTGSYRPRNAGGRYTGTLTLEQAFAQSSNVAAVRLFQDVGSNRVIGTARKLGVTTPIPESDPSVALGSASMSLLELTAAYAGVAGNRYPVEPRAFTKQEQGWFARLWDGQSSLSSSDHKAMEQMLRSAINNGTGRAAMLRGPNFGKTGTSQDNRDALFVGYAGDLVVGVWIGNDDNSPLKGINGGGLPARIWRDFMRQALGEKAAPRPKAKPSVNPSGPVEPLDLPDPRDLLPGDIPLDDGSTTVQMGDNELIFSTEVDGIPVGVRLDNDGVTLDTDQIERGVRERAERARDEAIQRARPAQPPDPPRPVQR